MKSTEYQLKEYRFYSVNTEIPLSDLSGTPLNHCPPTQTGSSFTIAGICYLLADSQRILTIIV